MVELRKKRKYVIHLFYLSMRIFFSLTSVKYSFADGNGGNNEIENKVNGKVNGNNDCPKMFEPRW